MQVALSSCALKPSNRRAMPAACVPRQRVRDLADKSSSCWLPRHSDCWLQNTAAAGCDTRQLLVATHGSQQACCGREMQCVALQGAAVCAAFACCLVNAMSLAGRLEAPDGSVRSRKTERPAWTNVCLCAICARQNSRTRHGQQTSSGVCDDWSVDLVRQQGVARAMSFFA